MSSNEERASAGADLMSLIASKEASGTPATAEELLEFYWNDIGRGEPPDVGQAANKEMIRSTLTDMIADATISYRIDGNDDEGQLAVLKGIVRAHATMNGLDGDDIIRVGDMHAEMDLEEGLDRDEEDNDDEDLEGPAFR